MAAARSPCRCFKTRVLHFKVKNTPLKDKNGKRKFKRMLSFLFVEKGKLFIKKSSFEEFNLVFFTAEPMVCYPASRGFSLVFLSVVLPFSSRFWLLAFCFGCFCAEEKTSADSRLGFLLSMRIRYLQDLGGNHMTKPVVEPVLSTRASFLY